MSELQTLATKITKLPADTRERQDLEDLLDLRIAQENWKKGRRNATFEEIVAEKPPGVDFRYQKGLSKKQNARDKKALVKQDLAENYRRSFRSLILRRKIISRLSKSCFKFHALFGHYGYEASFRVYFDTGRIATTTYEVVKNMQALCDKMIKGYEYSSVAFGMRSPYQGVTIGPLSLIGMYKPVTLTSVGEKWLQEEPELKSIRDHVGQAGYIASSILSPYILETCIRRTVSKSKVEYSVKERAAAKKLKRRLPVRYAWTPLMKKLLPVTEPYLLNTQIKKFTYSLIDKTTPVSIVAPYDPLNIEHRDFVDEMGSISSFIDAQIEKKERQAAKKALNKQPELVRRKRKAREYEDVD